MDNSSPVETLVRDTTGLSAREVLDLIATRITSGDLPAGTQLPTIRGFAASTGLGTSSVAQVWARLADRGLVTTRRRGGTVVATLSRWPLAGPPRAFEGWSSVDVSSAHPRPDQLPDLRMALDRSLREPSTNSLQREPITALLQQACEATWPFAAQDWVSVSGAAEAVLLSTEAATEAQGLVAVQQPMTSGTLGNFRTLGYTVVGIDCDQDGPLPESVAAALAQGARTFIFQPAGTFSVDSWLSVERVAAIAAVLEPHAHEVWVIEEDVLGPLLTQSAPTFADVLPGRVLRLASFCRAFGLDLRTTVLGGSRELIERVRKLRSHGILAQSRILQNALAHLLTDDEALTLVRTAAQQYAARASALTRALGERDVPTLTPPGKFVVWLPAENEDEALAELANRGVVLGHSNRTFVTPPTPALIRIGTPQLPENPELIQELADLLASASRAALLAS
ncbi:aminotransferase class I/II-fold pyridoxal phosphate-dependent enzyme [Kineosporia babensis]|uniref:PLP-dependent aminotransferase family protein n=1 Tax=Kineosporia babensis TaxID=499548 RepID=A0A9X1NDK2_9ACTN|nr:PLP-dependent aminotransferase family protein [Kineosporia babensis]MCD5311839.1 PLP-dependent aminotransferase family protein [Kineosporia babensis]